MSPMWKIGMVVAAVILIAVAVILFLSGGGDEKEIKAGIEAAFAAAQQGDSDGVMRHVSRSFEAEGMRYEEVDRYVRALEPEFLKVLSMDEDEIEVTVMGTTATAKIVLQTPLGAPLPPPLQNPIRLTFRREEGEPRWRVTSGRMGP